MSVINLEISSVAWELSSAKFLISSATTEKPLPASPALAASIAAFKASRLVWEEILLINGLYLQSYLKILPVH